MENLNNLTLWDVKDVFNKVKNVVMNYTEMEAKVREATNNEPWGASSTLMQEIAQGTYSYQHFNEIMSTIYKRFLEKEARQWRQIYKALQLLEYLVKHGSERVVDDARSHITTIKVMRSFAFIDEKGKDQGINVRNRAREFTELLSDVEKIRAERKKAKANRSKYTGVSSDNSGYGSYSRYGGFGGSSGSGNESYSYNEDRSRSRYDDPDWQNDYRVGRVSPSDDRRYSSGNTNRFSQGSTKKSTESSTTNTIEQKNEVNLFDFDETPDSISQNAQNSQNATDFEDDFQEFQSAPNIASQRSSINSLQSLQPLQTQNFTGLRVNNNPNSGVNNNLLDDLLGPVSPVSTSSIPVTTVPISSISASSVPFHLSQNSNFPPLTNSTHSTFAPNSSKTSSPTTPQNSTNKTAFPAIKSGDIWASSLVDLGSLGKEKNNTVTQPSKPSMNSLVQTGASTWGVKGTWTTGQPAQQNQNGAQKPQDQFDSLL
ncbi:hypothetical protein Glove_575g19 [Diversispora epigaea]|uniref:ENTH domain-containing protein n=1 Tax=Diversispora epigaea TaxID=1348612 RepID=A0A397G9E1_9GLOM|nr:hypothetical protein Glove_575g19 [Diversispora epigaea]